MFEAILAKGEATFGKIAICITEYLTFAEVVKVWEKVTGKKGQFVEVSTEVFENIWGPYGSEMAAQYKWSEVYPSWHALFPEKTLSLAELGLEGKLLGHESGLEDIKERIV